MPQVLLIVFSVVLGLYLNQKLVDRNEQRQANELLSLVLEEVKTNRAMTADWKPYHDSVKVNFLKLKSDDEFLKEFTINKEILFGTLFTRGAFMRQLPSNSAWEIAKSNPLVSKINFKDMKLLADVYSAQEYVYEPFFKMLDYFNSPGINHKEVAKESLTNMYINFREVVGRENFYLQTCDTALTNIKVEK